MSEPSSGDDSPSSRPSPEDSSPAAATPTKRAPGSDELSTGPEPDAPLSPRYHSAHEALLLLVVCYGLHLLVQLSAGWGGLARDLAPALQVLVWILPAYWLLQRRGEDPWVRHGLTSSREGLLPALGLSLAILAAFCGGCALLAKGPVGPVLWGELLRSLPQQLVFVALQEEYFFRGVLQPALEREEGPARKILGAPMGRGALAAAALFALAHLDPVTGIEIGRLWTFFPALWFAWLRARTGSILPAIAGHAAANLVGQACFQAFKISF